jgi:tetratricopeptide (TPR) repeat protein
MKRYEEALKDFDRAIELDPEYSWAISKRGEIHKILGKHENAVQDFDRAISIYQFKADLNEGFSSAQSSLGHLQYKLENYPTSMQSFQKLVELHPENPNYSSNLGYLHLIEGSVDKAYSLIEPFMKDASSARLWLNFGLIKALKGQLEDAIPSWKQGLEIMDYESEWEQAVRCIFTIALGNPSEGLENMHQLINAGAEKFTLRNALNDATILSRCPQPIAGIDQVILLLEEALAKFEPIPPLNIS